MTTSLRRDTDAYEAMLFRAGVSHNSTLIQHASTSEVLWIHSMGKRFQVRAITTTVESANEFMEKHPDTALIACYGQFNIIANTYEGVKP
jgi:hypothetical protein